MKSGRNSARLRQEFRSAGLTLAQVQRQMEQRRRGAGVLLALCAVALFSTAAVAGWFATRSPETVSFARFGSEAPLAPSVEDAAAGPAMPAIVPAPEHTPASPTPSVVDMRPVNADPAPIATQAPTGNASTEPLLAAAALPSPESQMPSEVSLCVDALDAMTQGLRVFFEPSETTAPVANLAAVFDLATRVEDCPGATILVEGHTDATGNEAANLVLSWERAEFIVGEITAAGFDPDRFEILGLGSRRPAAEGSDAADEAFNRRVEFSVRRASP